MGFRMWNCDWQAAGCAKQTIRFCLFSNSGKKMKGQNKNERKEVAFSPFDSEISKLKRSQTQRGQEREGKSKEGNEKKKKNVLELRPYLDRRSWFRCSQPSSRPFSPLRFPFPSPWSCAASSGLPLCSRARFFVLPIRFPIRKNAR